MKKRMCIRTSALFLAVLLILFTACGNSTEFKTTSSIMYFGDTESSDPLRICVDIQESYALDAKWNYTTAQRAMEEFLSALRTNLGTQDIVVEFIPNGSEEDGITAARATAVSRLRVEMLAGGGPDVFIMRYIPTEYSGMGANLDSGDILIKSPQKVMESGLFLPLDEYIENNTQYTEWENFPQAIMDAGRNYEGQQIIPISYTLPVKIYTQEDFDYTPDRLLSWNDMLTDMELAPFAIDLINCHDYTVSADQTYLSYPGYLEFTLGQIADYEEGKLLFTEEELLQRVKEILALNPEDVHPDAEEGLLGIKARSYTQPVTLLPLYSDDGGITARIESYAAVNRNTDRPDDAFKVIDTLLSTEAQQNYKIYSEYFCKDYFAGFPMNDELYKKGTELKLYANEDNYNELCKLREQITHAYFDGEPSELLDNLFVKCVAFPEDTKNYVHETYEDLQRRVRE